MRDFNCVIVAVLLFVSGAASAQSGYVIRERKMQQDEMIQARNASGWFVTNSSGSSTAATTLYDLSGSSRDISAQVPPPQNGHSASAYAVDDQGTVFFRQTSVALKNKDEPSNFIPTGHLVYKLALGATTTIPVFSSSFPVGGVGSLSVNSKGQIVEAQYQRRSRDGKITLSKVQDGTALTQLITLPSKKIGKNDRIYLDLNSAGYFAVVKTIMISEKFNTVKQYRLLDMIQDMCVGHISSPDYKCATRARIRQLARDGYGYVSMVGAGIHVAKFGSTRDRHVVLSTDTFRPLNTVTVRSYFYQGIGLSSEPGSKVMAMGIRSPTELTDSLYSVDVLHIWQRDGLERKLKCKLDSPVDVKRGDARDSIILSQDGRLLALAERGQDQLLLDFMPVENAQGATGIIGRCE